jgi:hypothetical protein
MPLNKSYTANPSLLDHRYRTNNYISAGISLDGIPPFNEDLEMNMPVKVIEFKSKIRQAEAFKVSFLEIRS